jgi:plastocyanin
MPRRMRGRRASGIAAAGALVLLAAPAVAQEPEERVVAATADDTFLPKSLTIPPNTTVHFENRGLLHNVRFEDGSFEEPADPQPTPWRVSKHFDEVGEFRYYCENHGAPGGVGMAGVVHVESTANPTLTGLRVKPEKLCNRRTRKCRRVKGTIRFTLSKSARVAGGVDPVGEPAGRPGRDLEFAGKPGANRFKLKAKGLEPGRYRLTLTAEDENGNESDAASTTFRVKRAKRR